MSGPDAGGPSVGDYLQKIWVALRNVGWLNTGTVKICNTCSRKRIIFMKQGRTQCASCALLEEGLDAAGNKVPAKNVG